MEIKKGDVFSFRYNPEEEKKRFEPYHCFDGQLIATETPSGLLLIDTYWVAGSENIYFTQEQAEKLGTLLFVCNLNDIVDDNEEVMLYYAKDDWFNLSRQHGCYKHFARKKTAQRSAEVMLRSISEKVEDCDRKIQSAQDRKSRLIILSQQVLNGDTSGWIW